MSKRVVLARMDRELAQLESRAPSDSDVRWYQSVAAGAPDYGIYDSLDYLFYLWPGTVLYARPTLKWTRRAVAPDGVGCVVDLGCGVGYTTALLADAYAQADVYGTNLPGLQWQVAEQVQQRSRFRLVGSVSEVECDPARTLVVASEYFEHFYQPIEHLDEVMHGLRRPRWLAIANAFGARSAGHFPRYRDGASEVENKAIGRRFNARMVEYGYERLGSGWNGRPMLWRRA